MTILPRPQHDLSILVVDDSAVYRAILRDVVNELSGTWLMGTSPNGKQALEKIRQNQVDLVLLDVEMPEMNGLETLKVIRQEFPDIGAVMISGVSRDAADITVAALELGAIDFITKPDGATQEENHKTLVNRLSPIVWTFTAKKRLEEVRKRSGGGGKSAPPHTVTATPYSTPPPVDNITPVEAVASSSISYRSSAPLSLKIDVLAVGVSTGGPKALAVMVPQLPGNLGVPVLIVQHMPPVFTASLAKSLDKKSKLSVCEAEEGQIIEPGTILLAPGGKHMIVQRARDSGRFIVGLNENPPENSCRPAVDVLFRSVAAMYGGNTLALVMTGMGQDGLKGVQSLKQKGAYCLTQNEDSCVIYGMPMAVDKAGLADESLPLDRLADRIAFLTHR